MSNDAPDFRAAFEDVPGNQDDTEGHLGAAAAPDFRAADNAPDFRALDEEPGVKPRDDKADFRAAF